MAGKPRARPVEDEEIIEHYLSSKSSHKTARELGIGETTVTRVLRKYSIPRDGLQIYRQNATMFVGQEQDIRAVYETGATLKTLRGQFGDGTASDYALKYAIRRAGGTLRDNPAPLVRHGEIDRIKELNAAKLSQVDISLAIGRSQSFVSRIMRKHGIGVQVEQGATHSQWRGGRYKDTSGYIRALIAMDDPMRVMALHDCYVAEHRLVMARHLGRPLLRTETVHHINGDKADNRIENLELRHGKHGKDVAMCCMDCGSRNVSYVGIGTTV